MSTLLWQPHQWEDAVHILLEGGLVVFPTDTVYGVAASSLSPEAVARIYEAKERPRTMAIPVMVAEPDQVSEVAFPQPGFEALAQAFWPGPLTIVLPKTPVLPPIVTAGGNTVALRIPDHPLVLQLLAAARIPLAVTSANRSGQPPARTAQEAWEQLHGRVDVILDGGPAPGGQPSTILDLTHSPPRILREGPISLVDIQRVLSQASNAIP